MAGRLGALVPGESPAGMLGQGGKGRGESVAELVGGVAVGQGDQAR